MIIHIIYLTAILFLLISRRERYSEKELISFGNYMVSYRRGKTISKVHLRRVTTDADIENWKYEEGK